MPTAGAAAGPAIAGFIYDVTQSYTVSFTLFGAASLLAVATIYFAKVPEPEITS